MSFNRINEFRCFFLTIGKHRENLVTERDTEAFTASELHQYPVRLTAGDSQDLFYFLSAGFSGEIVAFCLKTFAFGYGFREFVQPTGNLKIFPVEKERFRSIGDIGQRHTVSTTTVLFGKRFNPARPIICVSKPVAFRS